MTKKTNLRKLISTLACSALIAAMSITFVGCGQVTTSTSTGAEAAAELNEMMNDVMSELDDANAEVDAAIDEANAEVNEALDDANAEIDDALAAATDAVAFSVQIIDGDGNEEILNFESDKATVGEALLAAGLISGDQTEYGLYVKTVNGITADYDVDGTYWAFYIDGEYASTGVDSTVLTPGSTYSFKVE